MHAEGVQGVVVAEEAFDDEDHEEAEGAGDKADGQGAHGLDKAGGGGDGDQAGNRAGDGAQSRGLAVVNPLSDRPADGGSGSGKVGVDESARGQTVGGQRAARVESEPAYPQQTGADEAEHHGVGLHFGVRVADALAQVEAGDQRGDAAGDVDHRAAGKVERRELAAGGVEQAAHAPDHVGHGTVDEDATTARGRWPWR